MYLFCILDTWKYPTKNTTKMALLAMLVYRWQFIQLHCFTPSVCVKTFTFTKRSSVVHSSSHRTWKTRLASLLFCWQNSPLAWCMPGWPTWTHITSSLPHTLDPHHLFTASHPEHTSPLHCRRGVAGSSHLRRWSIWWCFVNHFLLAPHV